MTPELPEFAWNWIKQVEGKPSNDSFRGCHARYSIYDKKFIENERIMLNLTERQARSIYASNYWNFYRCGEMEQVPALLLFDAVVQHGEVGVELWQEAVGSEINGIIDDNVIILSKQINIPMYFAIMVSYYLNIAENDFNAKKLLNVWYERLKKLRVFIRKEFNNTGN